MQPGVEAQFKRLSVSDQRHLVAVAESLSRQGAGDDLVTAGLLHDIGKATSGITIRLPDRIAKVVLAHLAPGQVARLACRVQPPRIGAALWALARHGESGAEFAAQAGYALRIQWLIANHDRKDLIDDDLKHLIAADEAAGPRCAR